MIQNWYNLRHYPADYLNLVYNYYATCATSYLCTYYHLDIPHSCADVTQLDAASYHMTGDLSGLVWEKITMFPIYNTEQIIPPFTADERGFGKFDQRSSFNFPTLYGITPTTHDYIFFEELVLNTNQESVSYPIYRVDNFEKATDSLITFWKLYFKSNYLTKDQLEEHVRQVYSFVDYQKKIYALDDSITLYKQMEKNEKIDLGQFYQKQFGYYVGT